ncbi:MAG TPA: hypothetical protein PLH65_01560 [bacterium]|mgnify:CR=1 FL=1|nr:hypothetical protein [bacterium]
MRSDKSTFVINSFLVLLFLFVIAIIAYLLYSHWLSNQLKQNSGQDRTIVIENNQPENDQTTAGSPTSTTFDSKMATFSYIYPSDWTVSENTEADFTTIRDANNSNAVTIRVVKKIDSLKKLSLEDYASQAAAQEIQGFKTLKSINRITADSGAIGYQTVWMVQFLGGEEFASNPITYFDHPFDPEKSIQINLENDKYLDTYNQIIQSFTIK